MHTLVFSIAPFKVGTVGLLLQIRRLRHKLKLSEVDGVQGSDFSLSDTP